MTATAHNTDIPMPDPAALPLASTRVVEFTHMVMGPTCGLLLADLGADVIKVEPPGGDATRRLLGSGAGFFPVFNRNKKSLAVNVKDPRGHEIVRRLVEGADVFSENFKSGVMDGLGLGYETLSELNPRLVYVSHKGFLPGPYENRTALDEVVQMMGGLAYMTGPPGQPLRAGSSVNDIMGGMFGAIGAMAALAQREKTGRGRLVQSALFENNVFLVAQHMMQFAVTGRPAAPMPARVSAWGIYDVFTVQGGEQIFLAVVSDTQWTLFCEAFGLDDLRADERLASNNQRVGARDWLLPQLREHLSRFGVQEVADTFERYGLPYARITRPEDLFQDPHLLATGGLSPVTLPDGQQTLTPLLPVALDGQRLPVREPPPATGQHTTEILRSIGYLDGEIDALRSAGVI